MAKEVSKMQEELNKANQEAAKLKAEHKKMQESIDGASDLVQYSLAIIPECLPD